MFNVFSKAFIDPKNNQKNTLKPTNTLNLNNSSNFLNRSISENANDEKKQLSLKDRLATVRNVQNILNKKIVSKTDNKLENKFENVTNNSFQLKTNIHTNETNKTNDALNKFKSYSNVINNKNNEDDVEKKLKKRKRRTKLEMQMLRMQQEKGKQNEKPNEKQYEKQNEKNDDYDDDEYNEYNENENVYKEQRRNKVSVNTEYDEEDENDNENENKDNRENIENKDNRENIKPKRKRRKKKEMEALRAQMLQEKLNKQNSQNAQNDDNTMKRRRGRPKLNNNINNINDKLKQNDIRKYYSKDNEIIKENKNQSSDLFNVVKTSSKNSELFMKIKPTKILELENHFQNNIKNGVTCIPLTYQVKGGGMGIIKIKPNSYYGPVKNNNGFMTFLILDCEYNNLLIDVGINNNAYECEKHMQLLISPGDSYMFHNRSKEYDAKLLLIVCNKLDEPFNVSTHIKETQ